MSEQPDILRLGIVGCGGISHAHGVAAQSVDGARFVACCDVREDAAKEWAKVYGCDSTCTDYVEMLVEEELDAVVLATWPNQHREQIEKCLEAGMKKILCEKTLCLTGKEAIEIHGLVENAGAFLMEAFMYRHHPAIRKIEEILSSDTYGEVDCVRANFSSFDPETESADNAERNWRQRKECGGGIPYDFACYCVNACNHFSPSLPRRVMATGTVSEKYDIINRFYGLIEYENDRSAMIESSKKANCSQELEVVCGGGRITLPISWTIPGDIDVEERHSPNWVTYERKSSSIPATDPYTKQLANFVAVVRGKAERQCR